MKIEWYIKCPLCGKKIYLPFLKSYLFCFKCGWASYDPFQPESWRKRQENDWKKIQEMRNK